MSDNTKLGLKDYRSLIYDHIKRSYREREAPGHVSSFHSHTETIRRAERPNTASKGDRQEATGQYYYRNNSNNSKNEKPKTTDAKGHSYIHSGKANISPSSFYEEDERLKKKSSLKEILKNKKTLVGYKAIPESKTVIVKKSMKDYDYCSSSKENRNFYGKFY